MRGPAGDRAALEDMLAYAREARSHAPERRALDDDTTCHAVLYELAIVGESAHRVSRQLQQQHPEVPWPRVISQRNILVHVYDQVDLDLVWDAVEQLSDLESKVLTIIQELPA